MLLALFWGFAAEAGAQVRYEPSPLNVVQAMNDLAAVRPGDLVYDLGCGDGRIVIDAARRGARAVCIDNDPRRIREAQRNARKAGVEGHIEFRVQDLFEVDLRDATVVMLFLSADFNRRLEPRLRALAAGTRIVSHWHRMGDWDPHQELSVRSGAREHPVYLWVVQG
jgi:SAM-dependent methyltransferase